MAILYFSLLLLLSGASSITVTRNLARYIQSLIQTFLQNDGKSHTSYYCLILYTLYIGQHFPDLVNPPTSICTSSNPIPDDFLVPKIIIWNPLKKHSFLFGEDRELQCSVCGKLCTTSGWLDGTSGHCQPRLLHDVDDVVLLVSAVYACSEGHKILAHDERIVSMLPREMVPFVHS